MKKKKSIQFRADPEFINLIEDIRYKKRKDGIKASYVDITRDLAKEFEAHKKREREKRRFW